MFPRTHLSRSGLKAMLPWFKPLHLLSLPGLAGPACPPELLEADWVRQFEPVSGAGAADLKELDRLLGQWQQWLEGQRGSGRLESFKAGIKPPPDLEKIRNLIKEVRAYGQGAVPEQVNQAPPDMIPALLLRLAHFQDRQESEMEGILSQVQGRRSMMTKALGLEEPDAEPADYAQVAEAPLPPLGLDDDQAMALRLSSWASLAGGAIPEDGWLATDSPAVAAMLMERANSRLSPLAKEPRSPAGALDFSRIMLAPADPDRPQAQVVLQLVLPGLLETGPPDLVQAMAKLGQTGGLEEVRSGIREILTSLSGEPWDGGLRSSLREMASQAEAKAKQAFDDVGFDPDPAPTSLSLVAFPGLDRSRLVDLMKDDWRHCLEKLPQMQDWPQGWPPGSCPLLVIAPIS
ncbi:MAG: hypothetical protein PVG03_17340 [Desulfarculaceae bacterium]